MNARQTDGSAPAKECLMFLGNEPIREIRDDPAMISGYRGDDAECL